MVSGEGKSRARWLGFCVVTTIGTTGRWECRDALRGPRLQRWRSRCRADAEQMQEWAVNRHGSNLEFRRNQPPRVYRRLCGLSADLGVGFVDGLIRSCWVAGCWVVEIVSWSSACRCHGALVVWRGICQQGCGQLDPTIWPANDSPHIFERCNVGLGWSVSRCFGTFQVRV